MKKISRRELGALAASLAAARSVATPAQAPGATYTGPLTGVTSGLEGRKFDPVAYTVDRYASAPQRLRFQAGSRAEAERWQTTLRTKLIELIGGFPSDRTPLQPTTLETRTFPRYRREKIVFNSRSDVTVLAYVVKPSQAPNPSPVVICIPGHGRGVDDIVGIDEGGQDRTERVGYQYDFAIQVAEAGLTAVAIEPMAFGCRRDPLNARKGLAQKACEPAAGGALLLGETMIGWRVWDVMRTIDYIATRADLNADRVACLGISGGGTTTLFSAALDPRIRVAMVSGYLNTFRDSIGSLAHCIDNYVPGILNWAEMYDIAGLIAPRALFVESGERDNIFPIAASVESFSKVRDVYKTFDATDRIEHEVFPGEHSFWGRRGIPFVARHLA
jgi:dienelactone hydrolase